MHSLYLKAHRFYTTTTTKYIQIGPKKKLLYTRLFMILQMCFQVGSVKYTTYGTVHSTNEL